MSAANDKCVLAVMDESATQLDLWAQDSGLSASQFSPELREARAAVAEAFAERDRLRNIVRSHEAQILRMTDERAELVASGRNLSDYLDGYLNWQRGHGGDPVGLDIAETDIKRFRAALARCGGAK